jgi:hypothetical protein
MGNYLDGGRKLKRSSGTFIFACEQAPLGESNVRLPRYICVYKRGGEGQGVTTGFIKILSVFFYFFLFV